MGTCRQYAIATSLAFAVSLGTVEARANLCADIERGTYASNVCWLIEAPFDELTPKVTIFLNTAGPLIELYGGMDQLNAKDRAELEELTVIDSLVEEKCTVTYTTMGESNTIDFNKVHTVNVSDIQPSLIPWEPYASSVKYTLHGNGFSEDGRRKITFFSAGASKESATRAMDNLYDQYCSGIDSEF